MRGEGRGGDEERSPRGGEERRGGEEECVRRVVVRLWSCSEGFVST